MSYADIRYVSAVTTYLRSEPDRESKRVTQCLWGDWVGVKNVEARGGWLEVRVRGADGWLLERELTGERLLEVNFVDIGQGDGTFVVTPRDAKLVVDAGAGSNMHRFLRWRFNIASSSAPVRIDTAIISHPDEDHYGGFQRLFDDDRFTFGQVIHSGIVERAGRAVLGEWETVGGQKYLTEIVADQATLRTLLSDPANRGRKLYPKLLWTALGSGRVGDIRAAALGETVLAEEQDGKQLSLKVLAPVPDRVDGAPALRWFDDEPGPTAGGDVGKTKNGHSVVAMLQYGKVRILLGGDLNVPAEEHLMEHYRDDAGTFAADVAKACHHGSADFSTRFLDLIRPVATVISSGDDEPHAHPRADTLGTLGKHSRGDRSLIFSTELARSAPERIIAPGRVRNGILNLVERLVAATDEATRVLARATVMARLEEVVQRSVSMYGLITLRTDGERVVIAQRLEKARNATKWDVYPLERDENDELVFRSRHSEPAALPARRSPRRRPDR